ncbi:hypothetical protein KTJ16_02395 [Acinetobacter bereziniae]|uniref:Uncharacterized protein n=1 Tax=Acinetobacter bereziniae TaxID=106648 RepID=A0A8B5S462_ACIBZ|nr:hypothetical protein [Acinetobacter bereziniae]MEC8125397.1 hypothetical protein [Pseudomonadota bacterium]MBJ8421306.1 hypothetical protein [Acinetobacter bereziniae]MCU4473675.1 hypothetical protein [Acinetobacter bereziniae]MCU4540026.1 hypothetical protein [Acinetobacter bereziniae]MCU4627116.1 hypothetical protein [Acinetobacter bereziniae]
MLSIYLTDAQKHVQFKDYPGEHPVKFILNFKKIFPSVMEILLPVLPEDEDLEKMTWESTSEDFETFKKLLTGWGVIELRLQAISQYKTKDFADQLLKQAQAKRKEFAKQQQQLSTVELDYLFMHETHALIDAELIDLGEKFYLPTLRELWKNTVSAKVLNAHF